MSRASFFLSFALIALFFSSCTHYTTPVPNDPLFRTSKYQKEKLQGTGDRYLLRNAELVSIGDFQPQKGETYAHFQQRIFNTLIVQEYEKEKLAESILDNEVHAESMKKQFVDYQTQNIDMRMAIARLSSDDGASASSQQYLFQRYEIQPGDTLQKIAWSHYGTHRAWLAIYRFNVSLLSAGPNKIFAGHSIMLPKFPAHQ